VDNEEVFNHGDITPSKHRAIVGALAKLCASHSIKLPAIIGPETYSPNGGRQWLHELFSNGWGGSIQRAGVHYYSEKRNTAYAHDLAQYAAAAGNKPLWDSEFHWANFGKGEYADAKYGLMGAFDHFDSGFNGMIMWGFHPGSLGTPRAEIQTALVVSTAGARPVDVGDQDGVAMKAGKLNTRAFRRGHDLHLWVINDMDHDLEAKKVEVHGAKLSTAPAYARWSNSNRSDGQATVVNGHVFKMPFPSKTVTYVVVPNAIP